MNDILRYYRRQSRKQKKKRKNKKRKIKKRKCDLKNERPEYNRVHFSLTASFEHLRRAEWWMFVSGFPPTCSDVRLCWLSCSVVSFVFPSSLDIGFSSFIFATSAIISFAFRFNFYFIRHFFFFFSFFLVLIHYYYYWCLFQCGWIMCRVHFLCRCRRHFVKVLII